MKNNLGQYKAKDLTGLKIGMLTAIEPTGEKNKNDGSWIWLFKCDCGKTREIAASRINNDFPPFSCGCKRKENKGQAQPIDLAGQRNFMVVMLEPTEKRCKGGYVIWKIKCDCGKIFERPSYAFLRKTVKSCGCRHFVPKGRPRIANSGAHVNSIYGHYKQSAKSRNIEFNLSKEEFQSIIEKKCFYCGIEPRESSAHSNLCGTYSWNGVDRMDSSVGYLTENCVPCCSSCNWSKGTRSVDEFYAWIQRAYNHLFS